MRFSWFLCPFCGLSHFPSSTFPPSLTRSRNVFGVLPVSKLRIIKNLQKWTKNENLNTSTSWLFNRRSVRGDMVHYWTAPVRFLKKRIFNIVFGITMILRLHTNKYTESRKYWLVKVVPHQELQILYIPLIFPLFTNLSLCPTPPFTSQNVLLNLYLLSAASSFL